ncbi:hypothetical protein CBR_g37283 [Chara braunii]|uniref:CCHC-type domain-containing protein n=1 Tax=Chara braunii TaxID=69332 RepID=A0A388LMV3_CHABU|nr:hypothetical protein CBR_g37283 [Chara braunii]|eukprot:GBG83565.1 hypothetical protein CBR_g37283 [Chara braunii]
MEAAGIVPMPPVDPQTSEQRIDELWARYESQRDAAHHRLQETGHADERVGELRDMGDLGFSATRMAVERVDRRIREVAVTSFDWFSLLSDELAAGKLEVEHLTTQLAMERARTQAKEVEWERRFGETAAIMDRLSAAWVASQIRRAGADGQDRGTQVSPSLGATAKSPRQKRPMEEVSLDSAKEEATRGVEEWTIGAGASIEEAIQPRVSPSYEAGAEGLIQGPSYLSEEESGAQELLMAMSTEKRGSRLHELVTAMGIGTPQERQQQEVVSGPATVVVPQLSGSCGDERMVVVGRPCERRPQGLDTPEYGSESIVARGSEDAEAVEPGSQGYMGVPLCHEVTTEAKGTPTSSYRGRKKKTARWFDASCFWCKKEAHRALDCPELLEDKAKGHVAEVDDKFYDRQGRIVERAPDGGRAQLYRQNQEELRE